MLTFLEYVKQTQMMPEDELAMLNDRIRRYELSVGMSLPDHQFLKKEIAQMKARQRTLQVDITLRNLKKTG
jgi:hypothetical protein